MALNGSFYNYPTSSFGLYCEWSGRQSVTGNYTDVTLQVYLSYYTLEVGSRSDSTIAINGTSETYTAASINDYSSGWKKKLLKTKTVRVYHNTNGTKTGVSLSASWRFSGTYSGVSIGTITASASVDLNSIDRSAPSVSFSTSNITSAGFKISASSNVTADIWQYSTDGGTSWTQFSTTAGTTASITLSNLSANTSYSVKVRARKKSNQVYGTSSAASVKTLGASVLHSASQVTADAASVSIVASVTSYDGSFYHKLVINNGSKDIITINIGKLTAGKANRTVTLTAAQRTTLLQNITGKTLSGNLYLKTYTSSAYSTQVGSTDSCSCTFATTEANSAPIFTGFTYSDTRSTVANVVGDASKLLQTYSYLQVVCTAGTPKNEANIASYSASIGGVSKTNTTTTLNIGTLSKSGNLEIAVTCTDSRGWSTTVKQTITVLAYSKPKLTAYRLRRKDEVGELIQLSFNGSISAIKADGETNTNSLKFVGYYYKKTDEDDWGSWHSLLSSTTKNGTTFSFSTEELMELDANQSYDFHILIRDQLDTYSSCDLYLVLTQGTPIIALRKRNSTYNFPRVGINNPNPTEAVDVIGNIKMNGALVLGFVGEVTDNFNNYKSGGYFHYSGSGASNAPAGAGILEVIVGASGYLIQRFTAYASGAALYVRTFLGSNNSWTAWSNK